MAKSSGFYRDDAARIAAAAVRPKKPPPTIELQARTIASEPVPHAPPPAPAAVPIVVDEPRRPLLRPDPPLNQNEPVVTPNLPALRRSKPRTARLIVLMLLFPFYVAVIAGSGVILVLAIKTFAGL